MRESTLWVAFLIAGAALFVVVPIHLSNFSSYTGLGYVDALGFENVSVRSGSATFTVFYLIFLAAALFHGMYGLRSMILELSLSGRAEKVISMLCLIIGIVAFAYGAYTAVALVFT